MLLDGFWKAIRDLDNKGEKIGYYRENYDDSKWIKIKVPGHWQEESDELRGHSGILWYRTKFKYNKTNRNNVIWLKFNGVFYKTTVWLNGKKLGTNEGYFFPFKFDVTNIIKENNTLVVKVESFNEEKLNDKKQVAGVFYHWDCRDPTFNPGGIWKSVEIYETGVIWIERVKIIPKIAGKSAEVKILITINSMEERKANIYIKIEPYNFTGEHVERLVEMEIKSGTQTIEQVIKIKNPKLWWTWDTGKQNMYCTRIQIFLDNDLSDEKIVRFGIKEVKLEKRRSGWIFYLNGRRLFIRGTNYGPTKQRLAYVSRRDIENDARMMREANINMVRIHAHVFPDVLEVFDEYGILVWQDMPLQWMYSKKAEKAILENARQLVIVTENNPCMAIYCCHNEPFKFPDKRDAIGGLIAVFLAYLLFSIFNGGIMFSGNTLIRIPIWENIIRFAKIRLFWIVSIGTLIGISLMFLTFYPTLALVFGGYEALIFSIILGFLLPWDSILYLTIFLVISRNTVIIYTKNWNKDNLDKKIYETIGETDMWMHPIIKHSGNFGWFRNGTDIHIYDGWYTGWHIPFKRFRGYNHIKQFCGVFKHVPRFISEYGAQAFPKKENLMKMLPKNVKETLEKLGFRKAYKTLAKYLKKYHQYQPEFMHRWLKPQKYESLEEFIEATQKYQAELIKYYTEYMRAKKYRPVGGLLQFMFTDIAPLVTWAIVDYWREPKKGYYALKESFRPLYIFMDWPKKCLKIGKIYKTKIFVVNDYHKRFAGRARMYISNKIVWEKTVGIGPDTLLIFDVKLKVPPLKRDKTEIILELETESEKILNKYEIIIKK